MHQTLDQAQPAPGGAQTPAADLPAIITSYRIAGEDDRFSPVGQRNVYLEGSPETGYTFYGLYYGVPAEGGRQGAINLSEMLLELAMSQSAPGLFDQGPNYVRGFGRLLGQSLAAQLLADVPSALSIDRLTLGVESVLRSLSCDFSKHITSINICYEIPTCPLLAAEQHAFLGGETGLAHFGLTSLLQTLAYALDPTLSVHFPDSPWAGHNIYLPLSSLR